jgi:phosphoribosylanthranilate isomerase
MDAALAWRTLHHLPALARVRNENRSMLTQIYEVSTPQEADAISGMGVDHVGVLVGEGAFPRELSVREAAKIMAAIRAPSKLSALFLTADLARIEKMARELSPPILHLGASSDLLLPEHAIQLRRWFPYSRIMRSVPVTGPESIAIADSYAGVVDFLLLDSHRAGDAQIGALGITHDWAISAEIVKRTRTPAILAGGLGPDNVAAAIRAVSPAGVDSKTKTDRSESHTKDLIMVEAFYRAAKAKLRAP